MRPILPFATVAFFAATGQVFAASALQKECTQKYHAAKDAGSLNGMNYNQFYSQCAAQARGGQTGGATPAANKSAEPTTAAPAASRAEATPARATATPVASGGAVFPTAISPQYQSLSAGVARRKTCDDQYKLNKTSNANGGLRWTQKGGGYYHECNNRLKG